MSNIIRVKDRLIGNKYPVYIIAEMSANHAGDKSRALEIIHAAKEAGADCIKIQTYTPDTLTINCTNEYFKIKEGTWKGENLYKLYQKAYTPWEWHADLKEEAEKVGLHFLSTPYDITAVNFLEELGVDFYKVASFEFTHLPFLKYLASKGKPIILSAGIATFEEIHETVNVIKKAGNDKIALLKCSSAYPAIPEDMNLKTIQHLQDTFPVVVGLSDHTLGSTSAVVAVAMGAKIIEKHLCLSRKIETPDSSFSLEPEEFKRMVGQIREAEKAVGHVSYQLSPTEQNSRVFRRSIFVVDNVKKGDMFTEKNLRIIRPGYGLPPKYWDEVIGKRASENIKFGTPLTLNLVDVSKSKD